MIVWVECADGDFGRFSWCVSGGAFTLAQRCTARVELASESARSLGYRLFPYIAAVGFLGAVSIILRLLVFGVNEQLWKEQANAAAASFWR